MTRTSKKRLFDTSKQYVVAQNNIIPEYDGKNLLNVRPVTQKITFTGGVDQENKITWNDNNNDAVITHHMNCIPSVCFYNSGNIQVYPTIKILSATTFEVDFNTDVTDLQFYCVIAYGSEYGDTTEITNQLMSLVEQAANIKRTLQEEKNEISLARDEAVLARNEAQSLVENGATVLNSKPVTQRIDFIGGTNQTNKITWSNNNSIVTIIHHMNCIPLISFYNSSNQQIFPNITILDADSFQVNFNYNVIDQQFYCIISYGFQYGNTETMTSELMTLVEQAIAAKNQAVNAKNDALSFIYQNNTVKPVTQRIDFIGGTNQANKITWSNNNQKAIITHHMNCIPIVCFYNSNNQQMFPTINILSATTFEVNFDNNVMDQSFYCIIIYGTEYGEPTAITTDLLNLVDQVREEALKVQLGKCTSLGMITGDNQLSFSWVDPDDVVLNDSILAEWNKTVLVRKEGTTYPTSISDGTILATTSKALENKNYYRDHNFIDDTIENGKTYCYKLFSQNTASGWNNLVANQYTDGTGLSWYQIQQYVRAGRGAELFPVGTVFEVQHSEYTHTDGTGLLFRVVGHDQMAMQDETLSHCMILDMVDCLFKSQYDAPEYYYYITEDTTAQLNKTYYKLEGSTYIALVAETDYQIGDTVPIASWYERNIDSNRSNYGSNNPVQNNLLQWANSNGAANQWFTKQTLFDKCTSDLVSKNGFLKYIDSSFLDVVKAPNIIRAKCDAEGGGSVTFNKKFFLLSKMQVFNSSTNGVTQNLYLDYYKNGGSKIKTLMDGSTKSQWWLGSPGTEYSNGVYYVTTSGLFGGNNSANNTYGVSFACVIA